MRSHAKHNSLVGISHDTNFMYFQEVFRVRELDIFVGCDVSSAERWFDGKHDPLIVYFHGTLDGSNNCVVAEVAASLYETKRNLMIGNTLIMFIRMQPY